MRYLARLALLLLGLATTVASAADWHRGESPHFSLLARASKDKVQEQVQDLERLHQAMLLTLGVKETLVRPPFPIAMSSDPEFLGRVSPHLAKRKMAGLFTQAADGAQAFVVRDAGWFSTDFSGTVLFHEYAHRVMAQYARIGYPVWYVEGFAEYFGATVVTRDAVEVGAPSLSSGILAQRSWLEARELLNPGFRSTVQEGVSDNRMAVFYAQSWLLTHYVLSKTERVQRFNEYFRRVAAGEDPVATLEPATGIAPAKLNAELRKHLSNLYAARIPASAMTPVTVRVSEVPTPVAEAEIDAMVIASYPEDNHAKATLQRLRDRVAQAGGEGSPDSMRWALAYAELRHGELDKAFQLLSPWARQDDPPFEANRLLGWAWLAEAGRGAGGTPAWTQAMDQARAFLMAAYKQRRNDAPTLYRLALALNAKGTVSPSMVNAAEAASVLEPQIGHYTYLAVWAQLQAGQRDKAQRGLQMLASNPHGGEGATQARAALQALQSNEEPATVLDLLHGRKKPTTP